jgi:predicted DNA-binding transcriptional regulator AlpA
MEPLLGVEEVSAWLGVPVNTLYRWRQEGRGPRAIKVGGRLKWEPGDVRAWLQEQRDASV